MYFICMIKKQLKVISQRVGVQILYLLILSCVGYGLFFWQKPGSVNEGISGIQIFLFIFHCNVWNYLALEYMLCDFCVHCFEICGQVLDVHLELSLDLYQKREVHFSKSGIVFFQLCEPTQLMSESWIYGTLVSFIAGGCFLFAVLPMTLKEKRIDYEY